MSIPNINELQIIDFLTASGGKIDIENDDGETPICLATKVNNLEGLNLLICRGGNVNYVMKCGKFEGGTVLHYAGVSCLNANTVRFLVESGGNVLLKDWRGRLPLHWAAREGSVHVMTLLLELSGGDMYVEDHGGLTLLHLASAGGNVETAKWLLDRGFDIQSKDVTGWSPLHRAADNGQVATINLLLDRGANIQAVSRHGSTPLHFAALRGQLGAVECLVARGANINARDNYTWTPLRMAVASHHDKIADFLRSFGGDLGGSSSH